MVTAERQPASSFEPQPPAPTLAVEEEEDILGSFLPGILRNDPLLASFMRIFDSMLRPLLQQLDALDYYFDPGTTPSELLPWLETWVTDGTLRTLAEPARRALLREAAILHRTRGTAACLRRALELATGCEVRVIENSDGLRLDEDGDLGINTSLQGSRSDMINVVIRGNTEVDLRAVTDVVQRLKPAHAEFSVRVMQE
jgi:phage tail-like protein